MLETWRRFNPRKVASLLHQHRKLLRWELRAVERLLATPNDANVAIAAERLKVLRQHYRRALTDHRLTSRAMLRNIVAQDFLKIPEVIRAQSDLLTTASEVFGLLAERVPSPVEPSAQASNGSALEAAFDEDVDALLSWWQPNPSMSLDPELTTRTYIPAGHRRLVVTCTKAVAIGAKC